MSSLLPGRQIVFSAELAATLGLEEAILLQSLSDESERLKAEASGRYNWFWLNSAQLKKRLPFWKDQDVQRIAENLRQQGVLLISSAPITESQELRYAFNEGPAAPQIEPKQTDATAQSENLRTRALPISIDWKPNESCLKLLFQHGVPRHFIEHQVPEFVMYWQNRGDSHFSWENKFYKRTLAEWRRYEADRHSANTSIFDHAPWQIPDQNNTAVPIEYETVKKTRMTNQWRPSKDAYEFLLIKSLIKSDFIDSCIPEFIMYWKGKGTTSNTWDSKFVSRVKKQWESFNYNLKHDNRPTPMTKGWQPDHICYDIIQMNGIDIEFSQKLIPEFVMYWLERNELRQAWNKIFLDAVKWEWAEHCKAINLGKSIKETSFRERLSDFSWG